ncbi:hypothetical protein CQ019_10130 [Arthrobacter sp. MYb229]|nr:hypothetical protein CQ019_10130 [Arthrobacter sp. MYb229]PRB51433.1 hypothetical protein CQ013_06435 [Arthrobacter sp. MYb216]
MMIACYAVGIGSSATTVRLDSVTVTVAVLLTGTQRTAQLRRHYVPRCTNEINSWLVCLMRSRQPLFGPMLRLIPQ